MNKRIVYTSPEGVLVIVIPSGEVPIESVIEKDVPVGCTARVIDADEIPSDRSFRNAWRLQGKLIKHDMSKAREIHRDKIRAARTPLLIELDIEMQKELEKQEPQVDNIVNKKQALRDATINPAIEKARTIEQLKVTWDSSVLGPSPY